MTNYFFETEGKTEGGGIAARNRHSETLLLFFGIHMANVATLAARQLAAELRAKETSLIDEADLNASGSAGGG